MHHNRVCCFGAAAEDIVILFVLLLFLDYRFFVAVAVASVSVFFLCWTSNHCLRHDEESKERREKNIHLNAIFIASSCNIGVNLFGGSMSRVYVCVFKKIICELLGICRRSIGMCIWVCVFKRFNIALHLHTRARKKFEASMHWRCASIQLLYKQIK